MKILQVTPRYPPQRGGVETHVREISERLADRGNDVTVLTADAGTGGFRRERRNGVRVRRFRSFAPGGAMQVCPQIVAAVRRTDADVVHAHNYHSFPLLFAAIGVGDHTFVVTPHYHSGSADTLRDQLLSLYHPFGRRAVRRADTVIAVSDWERERLAEDFGVDATVIPNGLDVERFAEAKPAVRDRPYLLTVGRLEKYKGIQHAIRTMDELPEYDLLVAGSGPYRKALARIAREEDVTDRVEFLGYVDDDELPGLYAGAEAYVTLSEFEAYGMTVAEALAAGTPCVIRERGALADWTTRGSCVSVRSLERGAISKAVAKAAAKDVCLTDALSWDEVTDEVVEAYSRL